MSQGLRDRVEAHLPRAGLSQLVAVVEEMKRRAQAGRRIPDEIPIKAILDPKTGDVLELEIPRRYGWT